MLGDVKGGGEGEGTFPLLLGSLVIFLFTDGYLKAVWNNFERLTVAKQCKSIPRSLANAPQALVKACRESEHQPACEQQYQQVVRF